MLCVDTGSDPALWVSTSADSLPWWLLSADAALLGIAAVWTSQVLRDVPSSPASGSLSARVALRQLHLIMASHNFCQIGVIWSRTFIYFWIINTVCFARWCWLLVTAVYYSPQNFEPSRIICCIASEISHAVKSFFTWKLWIFLEIRGSSHK